MTRFVDTHTHLYSQKFEDEHHAMIQRAIDAGVQEMFMPNVDLTSIEGMYALEAAFPANCFAMMGLHPCSVKADFKTVLSKMEVHLEQRTFAAIGETGLDYYWDMEFAEQQKQSLAIHAEWAKKYQRPIVLHTRNAFEDTYEIMQAHNSADLTGVFHCFSDGIEEATKVNELGGFFIGIGGNSTYKKSHLPEVIAQIPLEWIVLETDAPYLAPTPKRGKRNESGYLPFVAQKIAEIKGIEVEAVAEICSANAEKLYNAAFQNVQS